MNKEIERHESMPRIANLAQSRGNPVHFCTRAPSLFWVKKEEMTEGKMADRASKSRSAPPPPLAQSLDPPLHMYDTHRDLPFTRKSKR